MDQMLVSVCLTPQNEHNDNKKVANSHVGVILKRRQKRPKIYVLPYFFIFFVTPFLSRQFLRNYYSYQHN